MALPSIHEASWLYKLLALPWNYFGFFFSKSLALGALTYYIHLITALWTAVTSTNYSHMLIPEPKAVRNIYPCQTGVWAGTDFFFFFLDLHSKVLALFILWVWVRVTVCVSQVNFPRDLWGSSLELQFPPWARVSAASLLLFWETPSTKKII